MKISIRERYATVPNELLNNPDISLKAKGLFAYLQSKPDNWSFSIDRMASQLKENRDAIRGAIKELEEHGYLIRKRRRENGKWNGRSNKRTQRNRGYTPSKQNLV
jgi:DNA-binding MarR family transcriptional regulator